MTFYPFLRTYPLLLNRVKVSQAIIFKLKMGDKIMIKLVKLEHDLYRLEAVLVNTTAALHTYLLNGKRNPLIGKSDSDLEFERFEKFITGVENVNLLFPNTIEFKNCNTQEEAKVEWQKK